MLDRKLSSPTINVQLSAIRKIGEAQRNDILDGEHNPRRWQRCRTRASMEHGRGTGDARAVLRVEVEADLNGFVPLDRADVMVAYGPVEIGGKTYICPVRSVGIWRARSVNMLTEWNDSLGFLAWAPFATKLNDFRYDDYHYVEAGGQSQKWSDLMRWTR